MKTSILNARCYRELLAGIVMFSFIYSIHAQDGSAPVRDRWSYNTANLMSKYKWETGIAQPFRYGLTDKLELHSNVLAMALFPNAGIKISQGSVGGWLIASDHSISYPTLFMNSVRVKGAGGLISPQFDIPTIFSIGNSILLTKAINRNALTGSLGFSFAIRSKKPDPLATIDLPLVYQRMAHYYEGTSLRAGLDFKGGFRKRWFYENSVNVYLVTRTSNNFFFENNGAIMWNAFRSVRVKIGYSLSYGEYPFGTLWQLWPSMDLIFGSKI